MAEGGDYGSLEEKRLQCLYCKTQFDEESHIPRVLPCLHTLCSTCLKKLLKNNLLTCPRCHDKFKTPDESLETYQIDFTRKDLVSFYTKFCQSSKVECDMCDENKAEFWCHDCENFLCGGCIKSHERNKKWKTHIVVSINEIKDPSHFRHEVLCSRDGHKNKPLEVYCTGDSCKKAVCATCWMVDHSDKTEHTPTDIKDQFVEERDRLLVKAEKLNEKQVQITRLQKRIDSEAYDVTKQTISAEFEISSFFNESIKLLEKRRDELLETNRTISKNKETVLTNQKQELEEFKNRLSDANIFLEQSCLSQNSAGFLNLTPVINQRFEDLIQAKYDETPRVGSQIGFSNVTTRDDLRILKGKDLQKMIKHHAEISATNAYPPKTEIVLVNTRGNKILQVTLKDFKENIINDSSLRVSAVLKGKSSGDVTEIRFTSMGNGRLKSLQSIKDSDVYIHILLNKKHFTEEVKIESLNCVTGNPEEETDIVEENDLFGEEKELTDSEEEWDFSSDYGDDINHENAMSSTTDGETCSILIDGFCESKITENDVRDYFSNKDLSGGSIVKEIDINIDEGWCIVVFTNSQAVKDVCIRRHKLKDHDINVKAHDPKGQIAPKVKVISNLDENKLAFITASNISKDVLGSRLSIFSAKIDWSSVKPDKCSLQIASNLTSDMKDFQKKARVWGIHIEREVLQFFETLLVKEYKIDPNQWDLIKKSVYPVDVQDREKAMITINGNRFSIVVVGYRIPYKSLVNHINLLTDSVTVRERLENHEIRLLSVGNVMESIRNEYTSIKIVPDFANGNIEYSGTAAIVASAKQRISNTLKTKVTFVVKDIENERLQFFQRKQVQKELEKEFKDRGIKCAVEFEKDNKIIIYAFSKIEGEKAVKAVKASKAKVDVGKETPLGELDKELQEVRKKKGNTVEVRISDSRIIIYAIPQSTVEAISDHIKLFVRYPHGSVRCTAHFCTETGQTITTLLGDITDLDANVLVCSSDKNLKLGIGVGHDLVQKGGDKIKLECNTYLQSKPMKELDKDEVFCSSSGKLTNFRMVVHIPGEKWENVKESNENDGKKNFIKLITSSLEKAEEKKSKSIAMPALCCGNNEYPVTKSTDWIVEALSMYLKRTGSKTSIQKIYLCDKNPSAVDNFVKKLKTLYVLIYNR
ncbi:uncharacterized protein LOC127738294 isoform X1 [Mytilus californianus]|uniref:uncharacterized protein LOC127738294 isoform X1 n=1 Tax=Mytilus californianus TaxID=6549 RepID=UPI002247CE77|nr:uncharacterized protein LOC127738294 isoform X1 [Mytilus californianus]XP_052105450.1 uncharacterized protein LOC127738294 isoform X3 [Mytilus californianus]XP_052105451.1 uncharacterized protein LOC127738294 isoform X1 [Mytilus californianus]